jgi:hypothetical protein
MQKESPRFRQKVALSAFAIALIASTAGWHFLREQRGADAPALAQTPQRSTPDESTKAAPPREKASPPEKADAEKSQKPLASPIRTRLVDLDVREFARRYSELAAAANAGNADAAYELYRGTSACSDVPQTAEDLEGHLESMQSAMAPDEYASAKSFLSERFNGCGALSIAQRQSWREWLKRAATLGSHDAALAYIGAPPERNEPGDYWQAMKEYKNLGNELLQRELASGNPEALLVASSTYGRGFLYPRDEIQEYAYLHAYLLATGAKEGSLFDIAVNKQDGLTAEQLRNASELGNKIYQKCCRN